MISAERPKRSDPARQCRAVAPPTPDLAGGRAHFVARLVPLDPGFYAFSLTTQTGVHDPLSGLALPAVQVCAPPHQHGAVEITDSFGRVGSWLGGRHKVLFVRTPAGGGSALVTGYLAGDPDSPALELDIRRLVSPGPVTVAADDEGREPSAVAAMPLTPITTLRMGGRGAPERAPQGEGLEIVAHIRSRGDVRFLDAPWVGRLGPGLWIEGFRIILHGRLAAAAIEYKALSADGAETPWIGAGALCGTEGRGIPLVGFAVRQKAVPGGAPVDCEYTGHFQSGATVGPARNGAPCRSAIDNDPLEGIQLRIRAARPT